MTLKELNIGESAVIETVGGQGALRQHFLDMGLILGKRSPLSSLHPWVTRWSCRSTATP